LPPSSDGGPDPAECIVLVGLQGAGKTTLYRQRFGASHAHVSMDLFPNARHKSARLLRERRSTASILARSTASTIGCRVNAVWFEVCGEAREPYRRSWIEQRGWDEERRGERS
jgi:hypothetical protein